MIVTCLELTWALRYHAEPSVRRSVLFAVGRALTKCSPTLLYQELQDVLVHWKLYLEDAVELEADTQSRQLALAALFIMKQLVEASG